MPPKKKKNITKASPAARPVKAKAPQPASSSDEDSLPPAMISDDSDGPPPLVSESSSDGSDSDYDYRPPQKAAPAKKAASTSGKSKAGEELLMKGFLSRGSKAAAAPVTAIKREASAATPATKKKAPVPASNANDGDGSDDSLPELVSDDSSSDDEPSKSKQKKKEKIGSTASPGITKSGISVATPAHVAEDSDSGNESGPPPLIADGSSEDDVPTVSRMDKKPAATGAITNKGLVAVDASKRVEAKENHESVLKRLVAEKEKKNQETLARKKKAADDKKALEVLAAAELRRAEEERLAREEAIRVALEAKMNAAKTVVAVRLQSFCRMKISMRKTAPALKQKRLIREDFITAWEPLFTRLAAEPLDPREKFQWNDEKDKLDIVLSSLKEAEIEEREEREFEEREKERYRALVEASKNSLPSASAGVEEMSFIPTATTLAVAATATEDDSEGEDCPMAPALDQVDFANRVYHWFENADVKYQEMFINRLEKILSGSRAYSVAKRLEGCDHPVFEAKLDRGVRVLWTELRRVGEAPLIFVWFVSKHDNVSRDLDYMNNYFRRQKNSMRQATIVNTPDNNSVMMADEDSWLLDPNGNSPLKIYTVRRDELPTLLTSQSKLPLRLSRYEKSVNATCGTVLLVGRSGTGKTICLSQRMSDDRVASGLAGSRITQLFVSRSKKLRDHVSAYHRDYCRDKDIDADSADDSKADFFNLEQFMVRMTRIIGEQYGDSISNFGDRRKVVDFERFKQFYNTLDKRKHPLHSAVIWTQIRSCIKGSVEAFQDAKRQFEASGSHRTARYSLPLEEYLKFSDKRSRISPDNRREVYTVFEIYNDYLNREGLWDDDDRAMDLLLRSGLDRNLHYANRGTGAYDKVYIDEVQDSTEVEVILFFLAAGMNYDRMYLAGDPAQAIVEGVDFRFEEIRSLVHTLTAGSKRVEKTLRLVNNFRSHAGILRCASTVLTMLLQLFPGSADIHEKDKGLCKGPRPGYIADYEAGNPLLHKLVESNPAFTLICRDDDAIEEEDGEIQSDPKSFVKPPVGVTVISIRNSKGIEYNDVIVVNFFCTIKNREEQQWWKRHFASMMSGKQILPETKFPQMEAQLKLLYTAITRCCNRLVFVETVRSDAGEAFFRWLKSNELVEEFTAAKIIEQSSGAKFYTHDEWKALGISRALEAEGDGALALLTTAIECFSNAGVDASTTELRIKAEFQRSVVTEKKRLMSSSGIAEIDMNRERMLADMVVKCIDNKMYFDACDLCRLMKPELRALHANDFNVPPFQQGDYFMNLFDEKIYSILGPLYEKM